MNALTTAMGRCGPVIGSERRWHRSFGAWLMKRLRSRAEDASRLKVLERIRVTPRQLLLLIEAEGERLLVATSEGSASTIYRLDTEIRLEGTCS